MLTDRGFGLLGAIGALWLGARLLGVDELQIAAVAASSLLLCAVVFTRITSARLAVDRRVRPARLEHGATAEIVVVVHNRQRLPTAQLELEDAAPPELASRGARLLLGSLPPHASRTMAYRLRGHQRGRHQLGPLTAHLRDPFGLVRRRVVLPGRSELLVHPWWESLPRGLPLGGAGHGGRGQSRPLASGEDLAHVRDYVRGDDLRKVHWPSTAHRGRLMVRQPEAPRDPRATVLLDIREDAHRGTGARSTLETAVSATASVVRHLSLHGRAVTLVERPAPPVPTDRPWPAQLAHLAELTPARVDLAAVLRQLGRGHTGTGLLVAIVAVPTPEELRALARAGRAFDRRLALVVDTDPGARPGAPTSTATDRARALAGAGWRAAVLAPGDPLSERWADLVAARPPRAVGAGR